MYVTIWFLFLKKFCCIFIRNNTTSSILVSVSVSADMKNSKLVFYQYRPIWKLNLSGFIDIGQHVSADMKKCLLVAPWCQGLIATCTHGKSCWLKCEGIRTCNKAKLNGTWDMYCSGIAAGQGVSIQNPTGITCSGSVQKPSWGQVTIIFGILILSQLIF